MAKQFDRMAEPYQHSKIPFLLAEVITNGAGDMVDLICRFSNESAAVLLGLTREELCNCRFCRTVAPDRLELLAPLNQTAYLGIPSSVCYETVSGRSLRINCYQQMYGLCACILEEPSELPAAVPFSAPPADLFPCGSAVLELGRSGLRSLYFSRQVGDFTGYPYRELLNRFSRNFSALIVPEDWPDLLQCLMDAGKTAQTAEHEVRLLKKDGTPLWVSLRAKPISVNGGTTVFQTVFLEIDLQKQKNAQFLETQQSLLVTRSILEHLLDHLSDGTCLLQIPPHGRALHFLRAGRGLSGLLGYSQEELSRRMAADPLWRILADDHARVLTALTTLSGTEPVLLNARFRHKSGAVLHVELTALSIPRQNEGLLICLFYHNTAPDAEQRRQLQFYTELSSLLLYRAGSILIDYEPAKKAARLELFNQEGQRVIQALPDYGETLLQAERIHPDFRQEVAAAFSDACRKPKRETLSYLGRYTSEDFRWYQATFVSLADALGNVCRVITRVEDVSDQAAAAARFQDQTARWAALSHSALCSARLDLSANSPLDAHSSSSYLLRVMFGNSASDCIAGIQHNIPEKTDAARFASSCSREALLTAFRRGTAHFGLEHRFRTGPQSAGWVRSMVELVENPENRHIEAFFFLMDIAAQKEKEQIFAHLTQAAFRFIMTVDAVTGLSRRYGVETETFDFQTAAAAFLEESAAPEEVSRLSKEPLLPQLLHRLESGTVSETIALRSPENGRIQICCRWLDAEKSTLVLTGTDMTPT